MSNPRPNIIPPEKRGKRKTKSMQVLGLDEPCSSRTLTLPDRFWAMLDAEAKRSTEESGKKVRAQDRIIGRLIIDSTLSGNNYFISEVVAALSKTLSGWGLQIVKIPRVE